jgi:hypothetical protein
MAALWIFHSVTAATAAAAAAAPTPAAIHASVTTPLVTSSWVRSAADIAASADGSSIPISSLDLALSFALVLGVMIASWRLKLGISTKLAVAAVRAVVQLSVLGYKLLAICRPTV